VESTVEAAETFYEKAGFVEKERIILDLCVKGKSGEMYEEVACLYEPQHSWYNLFKTDTMEDYGGESFASSGSVGVSD
jgi:hypothetical protein